MKKTNPERAFVGDVITTKSSFKPINKAGKLVKIDDNKYRGMVVVRKDNSYGVRFGQGLEFTNHLNGLLSKPVGAMLERDDFEIDDAL